MREYCLTDYGVVADVSVLQTEKIQAVLDLCREGGGTVIVPAGRFLTGGLRMWSDTTLILKSGAKLVGSDVCEDYEVFDVPEGVELRTDMEMITQYYQNRPWKEYRRAIISVYGGKNISVIGEPDSLIDGSDCTDPNGEEGFRGPHGMMITNVENLHLEGYTIVDCGNFMHQIDNCRNIVMRNVCCTGGSDGVHLHCCRDVLIEDCVFHTGDDCIAGINMEKLTVRRCEMNTSCDVFRAGGSHILVEDCRMWGPGIHPHRMTVVQNRGTEAVRRKDNTLPRSAGRHNMLSVYLHFASSNYPSEEPYHDVVFRNCRIENAERFLEYRADGGVLENGAYLQEIRLENVVFSGMKETSIVHASEKVPLTVMMKNVTADFADTASVKALFDGMDANTRIITEA